MGTWHLEASHVHQNMHTKDKVPLDSRPLKNLMHHQLLLLFHNELGEGLIRDGKQLKPTKEVFRILFLFCTEFKSLPPRQAKGT